LGQVAQIILATVRKLQLSAYHLVSPMLRAEKYHCHTHWQLVKTPQEIGANWWNLLDLKVRLETNTSKTQKAIDWPVVVVCVRVLLKHV